MSCRSDCHWIITQWCHPCLEETEVEKEPLERECRILDNFMYYLINGIFFLNFLFWDN